MQNFDLYSPAAKLHGQGQSERFRVNVSFDGHNGSDQRKFVKNIERANISRMNDPVHSGQLLAQPRIKPAMRVRNEADFHSGQYSRVDA